MQKNSEEEGGLSERRTWICLFGRERVINEKGIRLRNKVGERERERRRGHLKYKRCVLQKLNELINRIQEVDVIYNILLKVLFFVCL